MRSSHRAGPDDAERRRRFDAALRHWRDVFVFARQFAADAAEAEDLAQEAYTRIWASDRPLDVERPIRPLLFTVVRNLARIRARHAEPELMDPAGLEEPDPAAGPVDSAVTREAGEEVRRVLAGLAPAARAALFLADGLGHSYAEIATILGASEDVVRVTLHRARQRVRARIQPVR